LGFLRPPHKFFRKNYKSVLENINQSVKELQRLVQRGKLLPVKAAPQVVSPMGVILKNEKCRLVLDFSASGVNDCLFVPPLVLPTVDDAVHVLSANSFVGKLDVRDMFLSFKVHPRRVGGAGRSAPCHWPVLRVPVCGVRFGFRAGTVLPEHVQDLGEDRRGGSSNSLAETNRRASLRSCGMHARGGGQ